MVSPPEFANGAGSIAEKTCKRRFGVRRHFRMAPWSRMVEVYWGDLGQAYITPTSGDEVCVAIVSRDSSIRMDMVLDSLPMLKTRLRSAAPASMLRER